MLPPLDQALWMLISRSWKLAKTPRNPVPIRRSASKRVAPSRRSPIRPRCPRRDSPWRVLSCVPSAVGRDEQQVSVGCVRRRSVTKETSDRISSLLTSIQPSLDAYNFGSVARSSVTEAAGTTFSIALPAIAKHEIVERGAGHARNFVHVVVGIARRPRPFGDRGDLITEQRQDQVGVSSRAPGPRCQGKAGKPGPARPASWTRTAPAPRYIGSDGISP